MSWGSVLGKIFDWVPGRNEHRRNQIDEIQKQMSKIQMGDYNTKQLKLYTSLAIKLRKLQDQAKNK